MADELITTSSALSVASAVAKLKETLAARSITVFAVIDHAAGAREAGLELADEVVVIFGSPAAGTGLLQEDPNTGIELPLRILVRDDRGSTRVSYRDPRSLSARFEVSAHATTLEAMATLMAQVVDELG